MRRVVVGFQAEGTEVTDGGELVAWRTLDTEWDESKFVSMMDSSGGGKMHSSSGCGLEVIDNLLTRLFGSLGRKIGERPSYFLVIPFFIALLLGTGIQRFIYVDDPEYLFSPVDGLGKYERELVEDNFPMNYSSRFNPSRFVRPGRFAR